MQQLAVALSQRGHEIAFLTGLTGSDFLGFKGRVRIKFSQSDLYKSSFEGFEVYRGWHIENNVEEFTRAYKPDLAVCFSGHPTPISKQFQANHVRSVIYFRNVEINDFGGSPANAADKFIANSDFTARFVKDKFGVEASTIPPLVERKIYETSPGGMVTFINPHRDKGRDIVFQLVRRLPEIPFLIVYSWNLDRQDREHLDTLSAECSNLTISQATDDMKQIYGRTKIILAPSQWQEAWGRIATEAHFSGIPVIASDAGGLPEAVGPGGVVIARDAPIDEWQSALSKLWHDPEHYREMSQSALQYGHREEMRPDYILDRLESELRAVVA